MALDVDEIQEVIILSIGDVDPVTGDSPPSIPANGALAQLVPLLWKKYEAKDGIAPGLRELYTRRDAMRRVMAIGMQKWFDTADNLSGLSIRGSQVYKHYQDMYDCAKAEITAVEAALGKSIAPVVGTMPNTYCPPARYRGGIPRFYRYGVCGTCGLVSTCICSLVYP